MKCFLVVLLWIMSSVSYAKTVIELSGNESLREKYNIGFQYEKIAMISFRDSSSNSAYTLLIRKNDSMDRLSELKSFMASYVMQHDGQPVLGFSDIIKCPVSLSYSKDVIKVNGQSIKVALSCINDLEGGTRKVYFPFSEEGKLFIIEEFRKHKVVLVSFGRLLIPFETEGFRSIFNDMKFEDAL